MRTRSFLPAILWFIFITVLFLLPGKDLPDEDWFHRVYLDKWVHSGFFFLLIYLLAVPLINRRLANFPVLLLRIVIAAILYGVAIEFIQKAWIPGRSFDVLDMLFDSVGVFAGYLFSLQCYRSSPKK